MLGVLATVAFSLGVAALARRLLARWVDEEDPALSMGLAGLLGLGAVGWITFFIGQIPGGLDWGRYLMWAIGLAGLVVLARGRSSMAFAFPSGWRLAGAGLTGIAVAFGFIGALAPSITIDWDTLAYHLGAPKIWLAEGQITWIPFIHQSNFPFAIDNLFIWGLSWGGPAGAKAFSPVILTFGLMAIFGIARAKYGSAAAWWSVLCFATVPLILWTSGTAYIDIGHGLYSGLAVLLAAEALSGERTRERLILVGLCVGFAVGTKYTGLQTLAALGLVWLVFAAKPMGAGRAFKLGLGVLILALVIGGPWYVKNQIVLGNPVYPFFYEQIGGRNWSDYHAAIYRNEQKTFGIGSEISRLPHAVLGLAYQPGRYVNPGQTQGLGFPWGATGVAILAGALVWALSGRLGRYERFLLSVTLVSLVMWFLLTQQVRYITSLAPVLAVLSGAAAARLPAGRLVGALIAGQAVFSLWLVKTAITDQQLAVVLGTASETQYLRSNVAFYEPSQIINKEVAGGRVALYDEVFGSLLDVPYFWANPGHSTVIPYETLETGADLADALKDLGMSHVYVSLQYQSPEQRDRFLAAVFQGQPYSAEERARLTGDLQNKWIPLVAEAAAQGRLGVVSTWTRPTRILFVVR